MICCAESHTAFRKSDSIKSHCEGRKRMRYGKAIIHGLGSLICLVAVFVTPFPQGIAGSAAITSLAMIGLACGIPTVCQIVTTARTLSDRERHGFKIARYVTGGIFLLLLLLLTGIGTIVAVVTAVTPV